MGLSEEEVFQRVTTELTNRGYRFFVHCDYDSILSQYQTHSTVIANGIPDILGIAPDDSVIAIEVKGNTDIKKGTGQATNYKAGSNKSYIAADKSALEGQVVNIQSQGLGVISVSSTGVESWQEPPSIENKTALPEVRAQLVASLSGIGSFTKIASLNLTHPGNFLAPVLFLEHDASYWGSMDSETFREEFGEAVHLDDGAFSKVIDAAIVLNLIDSSPDIALTDQGRLGLTVLKEYNIDSLSELAAFIRSTSNDETLYRKAPLLATWLLDQYRKQSDFEALYRTLQSFGHGTPIELTNLSARLIRDHPNTFLRLFCTNNSRDRARELLVEGRQKEIYEDLDVFREIIRQNLIQNFVRQLQHIGVLSSKTSSTTKPLEDYVPEDYPWYLASQETQVRF